VLKKTKYLQITMQILSWLVLAMAAYIFIDEGEEDLPQALWYGALGSIGVIGAKRMNQCLLGMEIVLCSAQVLMTIVVMYLIPGIDFLLYIDLIVHVPLLIISLELFKNNGTLTAVERNSLRCRGRRANL
jgi:hypothetical protein